MERWFMLIGKGDNKSGISSLEELMREKIDLSEYSGILQYLGYKDANKRMVFEGDVLELKVTPELMSHDGTNGMLFNSNLGKAIEACGDITSVILEHAYEKTYMTMKYRVYFVHNGKIERYDDEEREPKPSAWGDDGNFPAYLVQYGAVKIGNTFLDKDILNRM